MTTTRDDSEALSPFPANAKLHGEERQTVEDAVAAAPLPIVVNTLLDAGAARGVVTAFAPMTCLICIICAVAHRRRLRGGHILCGPNLQPHCGPVFVRPTDLFQTGPAPAEVLFVALCVRRR